MKRLGVWLLVLLLLGVAGVSGVSAEVISSCVLPDGGPQTPFWDSGVTSPSVCNDLGFGAWIVKHGTTPQLLTVIACNAQVWNINLATPVEGPRFSAWLSWWGRNDEHNTHPLRHIATLDGFPYIIMSFSTEGWVLGRTLTNQNGLITGFEVVDHYKLSSSPSPEYWMYAAKMWRGLDGRVYAVSRLLDKATKDFKIYDLGTGAAVPPRVARSILPSPSNSSVFDIVTIPDPLAGDRIYLLQWGQVGLHVFDVTNPAAPQLLTTRTETGLKHLLIQDFGPDYGYGPVVVNRGTASSPVWRAYTYRTNGRTLYLYDLSVPTAPELLSEKALGVDGGKIESVASDGELLVATRLRVTVGGVTLHTPKAQYFSVVADTLREIPSNVLWYAYGNDLIETSLGVALVRSGQQLKVFRMCYPRAYQDVVEASCLLEAPTASLAVARKAGMPGTPSCTPDPVHTPTLGFPGDTFTMSTVTSPGLVVDVLEVSGPGGYHQDLTADFLQGVVDWESPDTAVSPGEYSFTLQAHDAQQTPVTALAWVHLCGDPQARVAVSHVRPPAGEWQQCNPCCYLQGYDVRLSALGSDGFPTGGWSTSNPTWDVALCQPPADCLPAQPLVGTGPGTLDLPLDSVGAYKVRASVAYPYVGPVQSGELTVLSRASMAVGDTNGDCEVSVGDVFHLISHLFAAGPGPVGSGDCDHDGQVTVADVFFLVNFLFAGGPSPA